MFTEQNKAIARRVTDEAWNRGNLAVLDELIAHDFVRHTPLRPDGIHGVEGFKQHVAGVRAAFPDAEFAIEDEIAEGDRVVNRWVFRGSHQGEFAGIPATGTKVAMTGIGIVRIVDGKIAEIWDEADALGLLRQLGVLPAPDQTEEKGSGPEVDAPPPNRVAAKPRAVSAEEQKGFILRTFAAANAGDIEASVAATAPDARLNGQPFGREGDRERTRRMLAAFPDVRYEVHDAIADGDKVAVRYTMRGTQHGELLGIAPTGKPVAMSDITIYRISGGQIVEMWDNYDALGLLRQLGVIPAPGPAGQ